MVCAQGVQRLQAHEREQMYRLAQEDARDSERSDGIVKVLNRFMYVSKNGECSMQKCSMRKLKHRNGAARCAERAFDRGTVGARRQAQYRLRRRRDMDVCAHDAGRIHSRPVRRGEQDPLEGRSSDADPR